ncbi:MAG: SapC family protein [Sphingomonadaceae bacterium]
MATNPQVQPQLPLFYRNLVPLNSEAHGSFGLKQRESMAFAKATHAVPLTVDEFALAQRNYPIVFGADENAVPLALVGLREGENLFIEPDGQWRPRAYIPAYLRRHPFMLARLSEDQNTLSLMFDDSWDLVTADGEQKLFDGSEPSEVCKGVLNFCEEFEQAVARTRGFIEEVKKLDLLMDGQASIQNPGMAEPANFSGFKMVDEKKLQNIRGDQARKMVQNGMMGLLYAHLFSLSLMRDLFADLQAAPAA